MAAKIGLAAFWVMWMSWAPVYALTVEEIVTLKKQGVSDQTIERLIELEQADRNSGSWRTRDGWIVHSTEIRRYPHAYSEPYSQSYPIVIYPRVLLRTLR